jgi:hypothetical protein
MVTPALTQQELSALAQVLFASPVQPSELRSPAAIRTTLEMQSRACHGNVAACLALVAQAAGDRPGVYASHMRWTRQSAILAYFDRFADDAGPPTLTRQFVAPLKARPPALAGVGG